jgi:tetratricopeptide (TPR) repeat protein
MDRKGHLTREEVARFFAEGSSRLECQRLVGHLLSGCDLCRGLVARVLAEKDDIAPLPAEAPEPASYARILRQVMEGESRRARERRQAPALWIILKPLTQPQRVRALAKDPRYRTWGLADFLLERARETVRSTPGEALEAAELCSALLELLDAQSYPQSLVWDFKGEARIAAGNAHRLLSGFDSALTALDLAGDFLGQGTQSPELRAQLESIRASVLHDVGRFEEAASLLEIVADIYRHDLEDAHLYGKTLIQASAILRHVRPLDGLDAAREGLRQIDERADSFVTASGWASLIDCLNECGDYGQAQLELQRCRAKFAQVPRSLQLRLKWLAARLDLNLWKDTDKETYLKAAESAYLELLTEFEDLGLLQEMALAEVELMDLYEMTGRVKAALQHAARAIQVFEAKGLRSDLLATLLHLREAVERRALGEETLRQVHRLLTRYWNVPIPEQERVEATT